MAAPNREQTPPGEPVTVILDESTLDALAELLEGKEPAIDLTDLADNIQRRLESQLFSKIESALMPKVERRLLTVLVQCGLVPPAVLDEWEHRKAPKQEAPDIGDRVLGELKL